MAIFLPGRKNKEINKVVLLPLSQITQNPNQPRKIFQQSAIDELSESIQANGLLQPVTVRRIAQDQYELIAGERRTMAFKKLGRDFIPAIVEDYTGRQSAILALIENLQRKDLGYFEEAYAISRLMEETGMSQQQISSQLGKAQSTIANKLRLLRFPLPVQQALLNANLTERHARALLRVEDEALALKVIEYIDAECLNVQQTEKYIDDLLDRKAPEKSPSRIFVVKDVRIFMNSIHKAVSLMNTAGIPAQTVKSESGEFLEYTVRIPKKFAYTHANNIAKGNP